MAAVRTVDLPCLHYRVHNNAAAASLSFSRSLSGDAKLMMVERETQQQGRLLSSTKFRASAMEEQQQFGSDIHPGGYMPPYDLCSPSIVSEFFDTWCRVHKKTYPSEEEKLYRFNVFKENYTEKFGHDKFMKPDSIIYFISNSIYSTLDFTQEEFIAAQPPSGITDDFSVFPSEYELAITDMVEGKTPGQFTIYGSMYRDELISIRPIICFDLSIISELRIPLEPFYEERYCDTQKKMWADGFMFRDELTELWYSYESEDDPYSPLLISKFFDLWCRLNEKSYESEEEKAYRFSVFKENYNDLIELSKAKLPHKKGWGWCVLDALIFEDIRRPKLPRKIGLNGFADLTFEESLAARLAPPPKNRHLLIVH